MTTWQLLALGFSLLVLASEADSSPPIRLSPTYLPQGDTICPTEDQLEVQRSSINNNVADLLHQYLRTCDIGLTSDTAVSSCADIPPICDSGMRYIMTSDGKEEQVYCETNPPFDSQTWMRLAALNMEDMDQTCPGQWSESTDPDHNIRACGRSRTEEQVASATFSTTGISYSRVCGRITAYQFGATEAFTTDQTATLSDPYVDGVSITYGDYSQHIWTFAAARSQGDGSSDAVCPCTNPTMHQSASIYVPSFVGGDYFCETGVHDSEAHDSTFYPDHPLWDGQGCYNSSTCCEFNSPPWFCRNLSDPTTEDIEVRIMNFASEGQKLDGEDTIVQTFHLYVQ